MHGGFSKGCSKNSPDILACQQDKHGLWKAEVGGIFGGFGHKTRGGRGLLAWAVPRLFNTLL